MAGRYLKFASIHCHYFQMIEEFDSKCYLDICLKITVLSNCTIYLRIMKLLSFKVEFALFGAN